jgi:hypothetical protein
MTPRAPGTNSPLDRRTKRALERREQLVKKYINEGLSKEAATTRAQEEMRNYPNADLARRVEPARLSARSARSRARLPFPGQSLGF